MAPSSFENTLSAAALSLSGSIAVPLAMWSLRWFVDCFRRCLQRSVFEREVFHIGQPAQREREAVAELERFEAGDRRVPEHEAVPFPRRRMQPEQRTDDARVRSGVGDEADAPRRVGDAPHRQFAWRGLDAAVAEELLAAAANALDEVAVRFAAELGESGPPLVGRALAFFGEGDVGFLTRRALPHGTANLAQPVVDDLVATQPREQRCCRLTGAQEG